jgi:hypothetical protein
VTVGVVAVLAVFTCAAVVDTVVRTVHARGERRRRLLPVGVRAGLWSSVLGLEQELECDSNPTARKAPEKEEKAAVR